MLARVERALPKPRVKFRGQKLKLKRGDVLCSEAAGCFGTSAKTGIFQPQGLVASGTKDKSLLTVLVEAGDILTDPYITRKRILPSVKVAQGTHTHKCLLSAGENAPPENTILRLASWI